jgi:hypothetical protein
MGIFEIPFQRLDAAPKLARNCWAVHDQKEPLGILKSFSFKLRPVEVL